MIFIILEFLIISNFESFWLELQYAAIKIFWNVSKKKISQSKWWDFCPSHRVSVFEFILFVCIQIFTINVFKMFQHSSIWAGQYVK